MKLRKICVVPLLGLILVLCQAGLTSPAILERASQLLNISNKLANPIALSAMVQHFPNGNTQAFSLPTNTVFLLTRTIWHFQATDTHLNGDALLTIGNYHRVRVTMVNGFIGGGEDIPLGIPITDLSQKISVCLFVDAGQTAIPGTLSIRLLGFTAPNN